MRIEEVEEELIEQQKEPVKDEQIVKQDDEQTVKQDDVKLDPIENGYEFENYKWTQNAKDVSLYLPLDSSIKARDITVSFSPNHLYVCLKNQQPIFDSELFSLVKAENCTWLINSDGKKELVIELDKKKFDEWWGCVFKGEREIDLSKVRPPNANISDLDSATRATIDKMLYEQKQKEEAGFYRDRM